jgi:Protein of unknown function (DUF3095)
MAEDRDFYGALPVFDDFAGVARTETYTPLPDDWVVGFTDVTGSTAAIAGGRYKDVNMIGAGAIAAVSNALGRRPFPFVFGGDGASLAISAEDAPAASEALAAMARFATEETGLHLRAATIPVRDIRAAGRDVRVARYAASENCVYAMFAGGGLTWFEEQAKAGRYALPPAPPDARPDLSGLSCRWRLAEARHGVVLSIIVTPRGDDPRFAGLIDEIVARALHGGQSEPPVDGGQMRIASPQKSVRLEWLALRAGGLPRLRALGRALFNYGQAFVFQTFNLKIGRYDASVYAADVVANADFRKFDDGLRMTIDCTEDFADALEVRLAEAEDFADWGAYRQKAAQMTCFVPSYFERNHVHFVDGADGGYTLAAKAMKARRAAR